METTSFTDALGWLTEWVDRDPVVEITVGSQNADVDTRAVLEGRMTTNLGEEPVVLSIGRSCVRLHAADFKEATRESDDRVRLQMAGLSVTIEALRRDG